MAIEGILHLWNEWAIQILVLVSFTLQVFLLVFADMRRRSSSAVLRVALWLAYMLADSTVVYALGHLSIMGRPGSREHQLVAFWAPFLLLHLGGQDTITAYALEDNSLWLRHLQVLVVQALGVAYVLYRYIAGSGTSLLVASISMFVAGLVKYGERIWAFKCGAMNNMTRMHFHKSPGLESEDEYFDRFVTGDWSEEETLLHAHCVFGITSAAFNGGFRTLCFPSLQTRCKGMYVYKVVEMELSLLYDILYTKMAVIHTWYGICIHIISLLCTATTFLLFQLRGIRDGYSKVDIIISYVLLVGASVLEGMSLCKALLSSWTRYLLRCWGWNRLFHVVTSLRMLVQPARKRLCTYSIGQYNLFHLETRDKTELAERLGWKLGLGDWWKKLHFSGTFSGSDSLSVEGLKELVLQELQRVEINEILHYRSRGRATLEKIGAYKGRTRWSVEIDIDQSIIAWHIATDLYIRESEARHDPKLIEATTVLSNYMMFLLMRRPEMLPGRVEGVSPTLFFSVDRGKRLSVARGASPTSLWHRLKHLFHHEGPVRSRIPQRAELAKTVFQMHKGRRILEDVRRDDQNANLQNSTCLAQELLNLDKRQSRDTLELILGVWVEMMVYSAEYCNRDSHARQLSNGGEFITIVWSLACHQFSFM
ncbi:hypothetical protein ACP70R_033543 [Stipagrostis hirtigluma subsp. patula]